MSALHALSVALGAIGAHAAIERALGDQHRALILAVPGSTWIAAELWGPRRAWSAPHHTIGRAALDATIAARPQILALPEVEEWTDRQLFAIARGLDQGAIGVVLGLSHPEAWRAGWVAARRPWWRSPAADARRRDRTAEILGAAHVELA